jgi:hypothetical protein
MGCRGRKSSFTARRTAQCPFLEWIEQLTVKAQAKCLLRVERLRELGHELRRPEADLLRDGIYELRASLQASTTGFSISSTVRLRRSWLMEIVKERAVPPKEIDRAIERKRRFEANPAKHGREESTK